MTSRSIPAIARMPSWSGAGEFDASIGSFASRFVARVERSETREQPFQLGYLLPDVAALHPGYSPSIRQLRQLPQHASKAAARLAHMQTLLELPDPRRDWMHHRHL